MITNTSMQALSGFGFGLRFLGNHRTFKCRYKRTLAELIMQHLPKHFHRHMLVYNTAKGLTFLACVEHRDSAIWAALDQAITSAKATSLRTKADAIEFGMPVELELPF